MDNPKRKAWIDNASYEDLLQKWRNAPSGDPFFLGKTGDYYKQVIARKRKEIGEAEHTRISKDIGW